MLSQWVILGQLTANSILFGCIYGIAAIGLSLIFGTMRIIFLAQGTVIIFFAYITYFLLTLAGIDPYISLLIVVPLAGLVGAGFYFGIFRGAAVLEDRNVSLLIAVGLMYLMENLMTVVWSADPRAVVAPYTSWVYNLGGVYIQFTRLMALVLAVLLTLVVFFFLKRTIIGTAVRAASEDPITVKLMGINPNLVNAVAFAIGMGLAGAAGVGVATVYSFDPVFGFVFSLKALVALVLGGVGNVWGALLGGIVLGFIESFSSFYLPGGWSDAVSFGVFILVLAFLPQGFFGARGSVRKA
jgi:branched-chain amino acid transport system permease protein